MYTKNVHQKNSFSGANMINNMELLKMIMETHPEQPPAFILEQYAIYKAGLAEINTRLASGEQVGNVVESITVGETTEAAPPAQKTEKESLTKGYTRRNLKVKPEEAIQDDKILCCICGKECQTLTEKHLTSHNGLTREGYLKLCGYEPGQALMSKAHLNKMKGNVLKAQQARKAGKTSAETGETRETDAESAA